MGYIKSLQMIIHLPMLNIIVPGNVANFFKIIIPVVQFDILDSKWTTELLLDFDYEEHERLS